MTKKILSSNSIFNFINNDINNLKNNIRTRFAPELSGYIHLGHLKNININLDTARIYNGFCSIRVDDSNPLKNKYIYIKHLKKNLNWFTSLIKKKFYKKIFFCSNYFYKLYQYIEFYKKKNYILNKIRLIKLGNYKEKKKVIKWKKKIIYRIKFIKHFRTKYNWFLFPLYDWAHTISDKIENINYSICSLEFIKKKYIYQKISNIIYKKIKPIQIEHSKLLINDYITKKRIIKLIINNKYVNNKNDLRLLTVDGIKKSKIKLINIYIFLKNMNFKKKKSIIDKKNFEERFYKNKNFNEYINIIIINYKNLILFKNKSNNFLLSNNLLIKNIFLLNIYKNIFFIKKFKKFIKLSKLKIIICKNYKKNNKGKIKIIKCSYVNFKKENKSIEWLNNKYKNTILLNNITNLINNKGYKKYINSKSLKKNIFFLENIFINKNKNKIKINKKYVNNKIEYKNI